MRMIFLALLGVFAMPANSALIGYDYEAPFTWSRQTI